jgi:endonuclease YncB( thermonuclease family)
MGIFIVEGQLDAKQFWPKGNADADTTTLLIKPTNFFFKTSDSAVKRRLRSFEGAVAVGKFGRRQVVKNGKLSVRLQGIDAPELHFRPTLVKKKNGPEYTEPQRKRFNKYNLDYRQVYAETGASALGALLQGGTLSCVASTRVNRPVDAFDVYGRFVGDVTVRIGSKDTCINEWVLEQGYGVPGIYNSMNDNEIDATLKAFGVGKNALMKRYAPKLVAFNPDRVLRRKPTDLRPDRDARHGKFMLPKLFRRQAAHFALTSAKITDDSFMEYLAGPSNNFLLLSEFQKFGNDAERYQLRHAFDGEDLKYGPEELVFVEDEGRLLDSKGKPLDKWRFAK